MARDENSDRWGPARDRRLLYPAGSLLFRAATRLTVAVAAALTVLPGAPAGAQTPIGGYVQAGAAGVPGVGAQVGYVAAGNLFTREIDLLADLSPVRVDDDVQVAAAIGASVRLLGIGRTMGRVGYAGWDLDLGVRIGPGLLFRVGESQTDKNRRFHLFLEPFVRVVVTPGRVVLFAEVGAQRPSLRAGFWVRVGD